MNKRIAFVTGANRGLGLETCRQLGAQGIHIILSARDRKAAEEAAKLLVNDGIQADPLQLDVTDSKSIEGAAKHIENKYGKIDILINNAGVYSKTPQGTETFKSTVSDLKKTLATNTFGPFEMCQHFIPLMQKTGHGRIVNVSSGMGQLSEMKGGYPAYRISKTALNAVTKLFAAELKGTDILINSVCPGWVRTEMGGQSAHRSIEEGAQGIVWAATIPKGGPSGGFFRDGKELPW